MIDTRFYDVLSLPSLSELAKRGNAEIFRDCQVDYININSSKAAGPGDVTFIEKKTDIDFDTFTPSVCFTNESLAGLLRDDVSVIISPSPRWSFFRAIEPSFRKIVFDNNKATIHPSAEIDEDVSIGSNVTIGANVRIGAATRIGAGSVIGIGVSIGEGCAIGNNVSVECALIGDSVKISSGAIIGESGFGLSIGESGAMDTPHLGRVIIQDQASIGANTCIDRGLFDDTIIGFNSKIDNHCQIAHNVEIGAHCVVAALCGLAGSVIVGDGTMMGGGVGVKDHIQIGKNVQLGAHAGVMNDIPDGEIWGGFPARRLKTWMREMAWLRRAAQKR